MEVQGPVAETTPRILRFRSVRRPRVLDESGLAELVGARFRRPDYRAGELATIVVVVVVLIGILVADWVLWPGRNLDILYAVPVLIAALYVSPRWVAVVAVLALVADAIGAGIARDPVGSWIVTLPSLAVVEMFGVILADRRLQVVAHAAEAEKARADLQRFFGMVAHDLAGPLTALSTYAEALQQEGLDVALYAHVGAGVVQVVERASRFVDDLRDAARVGQGSFALRREPTELVALAREVVERQRRTVGCPVIDLDTPNAIPGVWDAARLGQVLDNLVGNAVKYSHGGNVRISLACSETDVVCRVADHGPGIPAEQRERIFDPFVRLDQTRSGTGLGLYIAHEIVVAHGGRIWLDSQPGSGSTFSFVLPLLVSA